MINAIKVLNTVSVFLFIVVLLVIYAYLPITVELGVGEVKGLHKQAFFYYVFGGFVVVNIFMRIMVASGNRNLSPNINSWIRTIIFIVNFYITTITGFIGVLNNRTSIDPANYSYLNYLGPIFLVIWILGLIFLIIKNL